MSEIAAIKRLQRQERRIVNHSAAADGWILSADTWTYASATTFTITGDVTGSYQQGMFVKWTQTTVKYGCIDSAAYGAPNTTITIVGDAVTNAAITENYVSRMLSPQGSDLADLIAVMGVS